jgi:hypothetical protein
LWRNCCGINENQTQQAAFFSERFEGYVLDFTHVLTGLSPRQRFRASRGIARALTGNKQGAIEDFQAYIKWTDWDEGKKQRQGWIDALKAGKNPFTPEEIKKLKG